MKRAWIKLMCCLTAAALCTGCSPKGRTDAPVESEAMIENSRSEEKDKKKVTLQFVHLMNSPYYESMVRLTDHYSELHPEITFEQEVLKADARYTVLKSRIASGETPDLFMSVESGPSMGQWADAAIDLSNETWWDKIDANVIPMITYEGKRIALPFNSNVWGLLYNKDVFEAAGITKHPETLSELKEVCGQLKQAGYTPFGAGFKDAWVGQQLLHHPFGNDLGSYEEIQARFEQYTNKEAKVSDDTWLGKILDLIEIVKDNCQQNPFNSDSTMQYQMLADGEVGMIVQGDWAEPAARLINPDTNIGIMYLPLSEDPADAKIYTQYAARTIFVGKDTGNEKEALEFVNWLVTDDWVKEWYNTDFLCIAPIEGVAPADPSIQILEDGLKLMENKDRIAPWGKSLAPAELFAKFPSIQDDFILGNKTKDEVIKTISQEWENFAQ